MFSWSNKQIYQYVGHGKCFHDLTNRFPTCLSTKKHGTVWATCY
jgi:hypothetical protein